jgi:hypothetical protein
MSHRDSVCSALSERRRFEELDFRVRVRQSGRAYAVTPRQDGSYRCERLSDAVHGLEADEHHATFRPMGLSSHSRHARIRYANPLIE